jgi:hypothetical protein
MRSESRGDSWILAALLGFSAGIIPVSNTWDIFMIIALFLGVALIEPRRVLALLPQLGFAGVVAIGTCAPFFNSVVGPKPLTTGILRSEWVSIGQVLLFFGFQLLILLCGALPSLKEDYAAKRAKWAVILVCLMMGAAYLAHRQIGNPISGYVLAAQAVPALLIAFVVTNLRVPIVARSDNNSL